MRRVTLVVVVIVVAIGLLFSGIAHADGPWIAVTADGYSGKVLLFTVPGMKLVKAVKVGTDIADVALSGPASAPDGKFFFAADKAQNCVIKVDLSIFLGVITELPLGTGPTALALAPDGNSLFIAGGLNGSVAKMDLASNRVEIASLCTKNVAPSAATSIAVSADGKNCFVTDMINNHLAIFSTNPFALTRKLTLGHAPQSLALAEGNVCAVSNRLNCVMSFVDAVALKNTANIETAALPVSLAASPDGKFVYECAELANVVSKIDVAEQEVVAQYATDSRPHAGGVTPDGKFLVVSNGYAPDDMRRSFAAKAGPAAIPPTALQLFDLASGKSLKTVPVPGDVQGTIRFIRPDKLGAWAQAESPARGGAAEGDLLPQAQAGTLDIARDEKAPLEFGPPITVAPRVDVTSDPVAVNLKVFSYLFAPAEIRVYTGARVRVLLTNIDERGAFTRDEDVVHGFCINGYGPQTNVVVPKGTTAAFTFTADKPGAYVFYCSRSCGPMHRMMRGRFIVE